MDSDAEVIQFLVNLFSVSLSGPRLLGQNLGGTFIGGDIIDDVPCQRPCKTDSPEKSGRSRVLGYAAFSPRSP